MDISRRKSLSNYKEEFQTREAFNDEMAFLKGSELTVSRCDPSGAGWLPKINLEGFPTVYYLMSQVSISPTATILRINVLSISLCKISLK